MPRVPADIQRANPAQATGARLNATVAPTNVSDGLRVIGSAAADAQRKAVVQVRQTRLDELTTKRQELANRLALDPEIGYTNRKGKDAFGVPQAYGEEWSKGIEDLEKGIEDPEVKQAFKAQSDSDRVAFNRGMMIHLARERQVYDDEEFINGMSSDSKTVAANFADEVMVDRTLDQQIGRITRYGERNGKPQEWVNATIDKAQSSGYRSVIEQHLDSGNDAAAKLWFDRYGQALGPDDRVAVQKGLEMGNRKADAQRKVDDIEDRDLSLEDGLAEIRKDFGDDVAKRDEAINRLTRQRSLAAAARQEQGKALSDDVLRTLQTDPGGWDAVPITTRTKLQELDPEAYGALEKHANKVAPTITDPGVFYSLQLAAADPKTSAAFQKENLLRYVNKLSPSDFQSMVKLQADLIKDGGKPGSASDSLTKGVLTREQALDASLRAVGIDPSESKDNAQRPLVDEFRQVLDKQIIGIQGATGKAMTPPEIRKLADSLLIKQTIQAKRSGWNPVSWVDSTYDAERYAFQNPALANQAFTVREVPEVERVKIVQALGRKGKDTNEAAILDAYNRKMAANADQ